MFHSHELSMAQHDVHLAQSRAREVEQMCQTVHGESSHAQTKLNQLEKALHEKEADVASLEQKTLEETESLSIRREERKVEFETTQAQHQAQLAEQQTRIQELQAKNSELDQRLNKVDRETERYEASVDLLRQLIASAPPELLNNLPRELLE